MSKKLPLTEEEFKIQMALGTLPPKMKIDPCRYSKTTIARGKRTCFLCAEKCIHKGDEFYDVYIGNDRWHRAHVNICMDCSWLPLTTIRRMINEHKSKQSKGGSKCKSKSMI